MSNLRARKPQIAPSDIGIPVPTQASSIATDLRELADRLSYLHDVVAALGTQLEPVRFIPPAQPTPEGTKAPYDRSQTSSKILDLVQTTRDIERMIEYIRVTLDVGTFDN